MGTLPFEKLERTVLVREEDTVHPDIGQAPEDQTIAELLARCVIVLDKPAGPTSHQTADYLKKILKVKKAGHSGTLDPGVTGVLPVAVGKATRVVQSLLGAGKEYVCLMHLHKPYADADIKEVLLSFVGKMRQLPPIKSAVKRQWRYRKIYYIEVLDIMDNQDVLFRVGCQGGTYIRKLCHDIGERLGSGAHMAELRRTQAGPFTESQAISLQDFADLLHYYEDAVASGDKEKIAQTETQLRSVVKPMEAGVSHLPKAWIFDSAVHTVCHGATLKVRGISKVETDIQADEDVAVLTQKGELIMVGKAKMPSKQMVTADKGVAIVSEQVFMDPNAYPKITDVY